MRLQITVDGKTYEVDVEWGDEQEEQSLQPQAPIPQTQALPNAFRESNSASPAGGSKVSRSSVMGTVMRVNVQAGQTVEAGQLVVVIEAMKMETNVTAPCAGTVKTVLVKAGDAVKMNQPLVEFA